MTLWGEPEWQHMQDVEQLHECTINRMSITEHAQPQATERDKKYTMHMHNTGKSTHSQHRLKYTMYKHIYLQAEKVQSHTAYVDTAHWSSTPCALQVMYTQVALPLSPSCFTSLSSTVSDAIYAADWGSFSAGGSLSPRSLRCQSTLLTEQHCLRSCSRSTLRTRLLRSSVFTKNLVVHVTHAIFQV